MSDADRAGLSTEQLAERLDRLGFVIVPHGDHIGLRGSLFTSVRVNVRHGALIMEPRFGPLARTRATVMKTLGLTVFAVATLTQTTALEAGVVVMFLSLALWGYDGLRYTLTESCMTQVRQVFNSMLGESRGAIENTAPVAALEAPRPSLDPAAFSAPRAEVRR